MNSKTERCPVHDMPDCSPLLNGCALLTTKTKKSLIFQYNGSDGIVLTCPECGSHNVSEPDGLNWMCLTCGVKGRM